MFKLAQEHVSTCYLANPPIISSSHVAVYAAKVCCSSDKQYSITSPVFQSGTWLVAE
jgi:hypothetical protein